MASLVAQMVKNLPAMQETQVRSLGWEIPWRRKWLSALVFLSGEFHGQRSMVKSTGLERAGHNWATTHTLQLGLFFG